MSPTPGAHAERRIDAPSTTGDSSGVPAETPLLVRRDPPETDGGKCHMTPILGGVEGLGFECDGEGAVIDRTLAQLHFEKDFQTEK